MTTGLLRGVVVSGVWSVFLVSTVNASLTFEFWDSAGREAYSICETTVFSGSARLSEDEMVPDGASSMELDTWAILGDEDLGVEDFAVSMTDMDGWGDGEYNAISINNSGEVYANLIEGTTETITASVEGYFQLAIYVPVGETYRYTIEDYIMDNNSDPAVDFDDSAWHMTLGADDGFSLYEGGSDGVGKTGVLTGKVEPYLLYGGFKFSATDSVSDGTGVWGQVDQSVDISLEQIPEPATLTLIAFVGGGILVMRRRFMM